MFLPVTRKELHNLGWDSLDIIFVTGDAYIDSPYFGVALLGKLLIKNGYRVGIISQPRLDSEENILELGIPNLFWGVSSGNVDSMVANYTSLKKRRKKDDFTPGGINNKRPDRALIRYVNLIKQFDKSKKPIVIGGIEASLRRIAHYDYWDDKIRRSILFDSKADYLIYGMAEKSVLEFADKIRDKEDVRNIRGLCYISKEKRRDFIDLPSFENVKDNKDVFIDMMKIFYENHDPINGKGLNQKHGDRYLVHNPAMDYPSDKELDSFYELDFEYNVHPEIAKKGEVRAIHTIENSITINRGCFGECNFCAITVHQGSRVIGRSVESIVREIKRLASKKSFNGIINDLGGPTANMYGYECEIKMLKGKCKSKRCAFPSICNKMPVTHDKLISLMKRVREIDGIKKIFVRSGLRYDLIINDDKYGEKYLKELIKYHISGQLKIAPEHLDDKVLNLMGKPSNKNLNDFIRMFYSLCKRLDKKRFLTYYIILAHPGCDTRALNLMKKQVRKSMRIIPEQVQIFTPLPLTWSSVMYYTEKDPFTGKKVFVEKNLKNKSNYKKRFLDKL